jgi:hypothetical protein
MIFWLMLKLGMRYRIIQYLEGFWFLLEDFKRLYFCMVKYLSFHNSFSLLNFF